MRIAILLIAFLLPLQALALAPERADLRSLFSHRAEIFVDAAGLARLALPGEVIAVSQPDLRDLRILDAAGNEVPWVAEDTDLFLNKQARQSINGKLLNLTRTELRSETEPTLFREVLELAWPESTPATGAWELVVNTPRTEVLRRVTLSAKAADGTVTPVGETTSLFRLPNQGGEKMRLPLPPMAPASLLVTLEGDGAYLSPTLEFETRIHFAPEARSELPLAEMARNRERDSQGFTTILEVSRPAGMGASVLRVKTSTPVFNRRIRVTTEHRSSTDQVVGHGTVFRVAVAENLEIPLEASSGTRLRIEIEDGDSPPLEELTVTALVPRPTLTFSIQGAAPGTPAGTLYFGGNRASAPRYDITPLLPRVPTTLTGAPAEIATLLSDRDNRPRARLGKIQANPAFDRKPLLAFASRPGAAVNTALYRHVLPVRLEPSSEGLSRLRLPSELLALARPDLADLRIVDASGNQWPYLLESGPGQRETAELPITREPQERASHYRLQLPAEAITLDQLVVETDTPYFDRKYRVVGTHPGEGKREFTLATGRLRRDSGVPEPVAIGLAPVQVASLTLIVEDGNDAPLTFTWSRARLQLADMFVTAPQGAYRLLFGFPEDRAPVYELARVRDVVLAVDSTEATVGMRTEHEGYSAYSRLSGGKGLQSAVMWIVLIASVATLGGITLRLARSDKPDNSDRS
ncbi:MAG: DUF3999 domain-containing protein [Nitrospirota bacterium]|nr:DUF3999 domain-containing protein [Nitrospirota bacterium]